MEVRAVLVLDISLPCHTAEPDLFFDESPEAIAVAKNLCASCPMVRACLEGAISRAEPCGVWGGELFVDGKAVAAKRGVGRPRRTLESEVALAS